jgi:hypothetical protein
MKFEDIELNKIYKDTFYHYSHDPFLTPAENIPYSFVCFYKRDDNMLYFYSIGTHPSFRPFDKNQVKDIGITKRQWNSGSAGAMNSKTALELCSKKDLAYMFHDIFY